jgi:PAS domain S-box-containing protein
MTRICLALSSIVLSIVFAAQALGLIPDRDAAVAEGRKALAEAVAIHCAQAVQQNDVARLAPALRAVLARNRDLASAAVRDGGGRLVAEAGGGEGRPAGPGAMRVPIAVDNEPWGTVELRFRAGPSSGLRGLFGGPLLPLATFVGLASFFGASVYLRSVLRHADQKPGSLVPDRVRATLNTVGEGVLVLDKHQRIALANEAFAGTVGRPAAELAGRPVAELSWKQFPPGSPPDRYPWARAIHERTAQMGTVLGLVTHSGGLRKLSVNSTPLVADDGTCRGALATFDDLTPIENKNGQLVRLLRRLKHSRRKIRRQQKQLQKAKEAAEAADRAKGEFLASVSHEIRTPMNAILGMTEVVLEMKLTPHQREYLQIVKSSADALLLMLNEILDYSKIEAGKFSLDVTRFDLRESFGDVLKLLAVRAHAKGLELACDIGPQVPDALVGDPGRLRQVIVNLVGNAVKFTERGEVVVAVRALEQGHKGVCLHFSVSDTGIGIPADKLASIFSPFTQADSSTTRKYGGTGLGLAISTHLVGLMGGRIWVESEVGRGSTFHFTARFGVESGPHETARPADLGGLEGVPVLVVDDNATSRRVLGEMLSDLKLRPVPADGPGAALAELARAEAEGRPFALALLDATLPGAAGASLQGHIEQTCASPPAVIRLFSSPDRQADAGQGRGLMPVADVTKPVKRSDLVKALRALAGLAPPPAAHAEPDPGPGLVPARGVGAGGLRVLLVDDNPFNQKVGALKLEKFGHAVRVAEGGRQALAALDEAAFDLVLMDMEMPGMDGLATTAAIREKERATDQHVPVVAMTAHAVAGTRERCLRGGMDGYLTKPIQDDALREVIASVTPRGAPDPAARPAEGAAGPEPTGAESFDTAAVLARVGGSREVLAELLRVFRQDCARLLPEAREAVAAGDPARLRAAAHTVKGMVAFFGAAAAAAAAARLEGLAEKEDLAEAPALLAALSREVEHIGAAFAGLCEGLA